MVYKDNLGGWIGQRVVILVNEHLVDLLKGQELNFSPRKLFGVYIVIVDSLLDLNIADVKRDKIPNINLDFSFLEDFVVNKNQLFRFFQLKLF